MPQLRAGDWVYEQGELPPVKKDAEQKAENRPGHKPMSAYNLPKWVSHPDLPSKRIVVEKEAYFGMAADGMRNAANWNVAHVAAFHDDLKLLSLATIEQCKEPNKYGMTPTHMTGLAQNPWGPSTAVLYELVQMGVADPEAVNQADQTPWHICQRMHKTANLKKFEKVLLKGHKPDHYEKMKEDQLRPRGKFAREPITTAVEDLMKPAPICLTFPGQGSQYVGMLNELKEIGEVKTMLTKAKDILGYDILDIMSNGPEEKLAGTTYAQPATYIAGLAAIAQLKVNDPSAVSRCQAMAGLSLGEYTALTAAGVFDFETGLKLVKSRAAAMDFETTKPNAKKQAMISVAGLEKDIVEKLCKEASIKGESCQIATSLFPRGFSVGGTEAAVLAVEKKALEAGALQAKLLRTSGAFHTPLMADAKAEMAQQLDRVKGSMKSPRCQVYMNASGKAVGPSTDVKDIVKLLADGMVGEVHWELSMQQAIKDGCTDFYECGPSKQLKAMMKRIDPKVAEKMLSISA